MAIETLKKLYKFKRTKPKTYKQLERKFTHKKGFHIGHKEDDFITIGTARCLQVYTMRGEYPDFEREPKYKGIIYDRHKKYVQITEELFQEVEWK